MLTQHTPAAFIAVDDADRALVFYRDALGLHYDGFDGFAHRFKVGGINLRLTAPPGGRAKADYTVFGWESDDIARDVAALTERGVTFIRYDFLKDQQDSAGIWTAPSGDRVAWFLDPDGNNLSLAQHA
jgi:catechol 2,3-dioxygenase-like lactoylglutathione lyase family enzyme